MFADLFLNPTVYAFLGAAIAFFVASIGSAKGVGIAGQAAAGLVADDPGKFASAMVMQALPSTQSIYGFVIAFMIINNQISDSLTLQQGLSLLMAGLPIGIVGCISAIWQGKVSAAGINLLAKRPEALGNAIIFALMVEMFAILSLVVSIQMLGKI